MTSAPDQALKEREQEYESLLSFMYQVPVGMARLDATGGFDVVNPEISRLIQAVAPKDRLNNFFDFLGDVAPELRAQALAHSASNGQVFANARIAVAGNGVEALSCSLTRAHRGAFFVVLRDATELLRREREEARLKQVAEQASHAKSEFLGAMSHEFRTPMNGVIGMNSLLLETELSEAQRSMARVAQSSAQALMQLLDDILDVVRLGTGKVELKQETFDLRPLVGEALDHVSAAARAKGLSLTQEFDRIGAGAFRGDPARLRQILITFLSNAVKFTQTGGVKIKVRGMPDVGGRWRLRMEVRDSGIGVSDDAKAKLFQPFVQVDSSISRAFGGAGIGLSLARGLAELMGGDCGVADRPGGGSIFWVEIVLPVASIPTAEKPAERPGAGVVLVVDDGKVNAEIVRLVLNAAGFEVQVAVDGLAAVEAARAREFALILMDIHMPRMDGFAATRAIRALPGAAARAPIIGMSANDLPETEKQGREAGMNDYVVKPLAPAKLRAVATRWARKAAAS